MRTSPLIGMFPEIVSGYSPALMKCAFRTFAFENDCSGVILSSTPLAWLLARLRSDRARPTARLRFLFKPHLFEQEVRYEPS